MRMTCDPGTSFDMTYNLCLWNSEVHDCNKPQTVLRDEGSLENLAIKKDLPGLSKAQAAIIESDLHLKGVWLIIFKCYVTANNRVLIFIIFQLMVSTLFFILIPDT